MRFRAFVLHPTWCRAMPSPLKGEGNSFLISVSFSSPLEGEERGIISIFSQLLFIKGG